MSRPSRFQSDVLIIGSGAAGLTLALRLSPHLSVHLVSKASFDETNTQYAQGGVAAVLDQADSLDAHVKDTLSAGAGLCHRDAVAFTIEQGPAAIQWLIQQGVGFSAFVQTTAGRQNKHSPQFHLNQEGGHSHRRIIHAADATGKAISASLLSQVNARSNITGFSHRTAVDLISGPDRRAPCQGAYIYNQETDRVETFSSRCVVLATGGASKAYLYTSNPDIATGDGIAMAWRAGCRVANMEFNQFHPTCLYHPNGPSLLVSEAIRGEGGHLLLPDGTRFMHNFHAQAELAPRDIVARAIDHEMKRLGANHLYLDISHKGPKFIQHHFPNIQQRLQTLGYDMTQKPIPIVPAAHYTCGGVMTDLNGATDRPGLYAIGETACTGLHGANRMASNSLLECLAFGFSASAHINRHIHKWSVPQHSIDWDESQVTGSHEHVVVAHNWDELRRLMWDYVGIVRTNKRLMRAKNWIRLLKQEVQEYYSNYRVCKDLIELRNLMLVSELIIECALKRKESRGLHFNLDYPKLSAVAKDTILTPSQVVRLKSKSPKLSTCSEI